MDKSPVRAEGLSHPAGIQAAARLGQGVDSRRRQPGRQRFLLRLREAGRSTRRHRGRRQPGGQSRCNWRRRSLPSRASNVRRKSSPPSNWPNVEWEKMSLLVVASSAARRRRRPARCKTSSNAAGSAIFLPPRDADDQEVFGVRWKAWNPAGGKDSLIVETGAATRICSPTRKAAPRCRSANSKSIATAALTGRLHAAGEPAAAERRCLARCRARIAAASISSRRPPSPADSSLATNGVVLYVARATGAGRRRCGPGQRRAN